jgi:hypothetical protein
VIKNFKSLTSLMIKQERNPKIIWAVTCLSFLYSLFFALSTSKQQLLDLHSFRQAQTGLGAYWLNDSSGWLKYEVPVLGYPWSIPFEFPTYQILTHYLSAFTGVSLIQTGRLLSYLFLILLLIPIRMSIVDLRLPRITFPITCLFLFTSSNYLYWSRSFMIETAALFLTISAIAFTLRFAVRPRLIIFILAVFFAVMSGLTKSTTYLSFLVSVGLLVIYLLQTRQYTIEKVRRTLLGVFCIVLISATSTFSWIEYSDTIKSLNPNGSALTSSGLKAWNYGTIEQRFSGSFWFDLIFQRTLLGNLGAGLGFIVIIIFFVLRSDSKSKLLVLALIVMFFTPLFVFTNLHIVHWYYQISNQVYLFLALAMILASWVERISKKFSNTAVALVIIVSAFNFSVFQVKFSEYAENDFTIQNSQILSVADFIKKNTSNDEYILIYGQDWSSALAFAAERKTATLPSWMPTYSESYKNPKMLFNQRNPGAIVDCLVHASAEVRPTIRDLESISNKIGLDGYVELYGCRIWH